MNKKVSRTTQNQTDGSTSEVSHFETTVKSLENELDQACSVYKSDLDYLREENSALIEHIAYIRGRNKELSSAKEFADVQESRVKKLRDSEARLNSELSRLRSEFEKQKQLNEKDKSAMERLQSTLRAQESELNFAHESETKLSSELEQLRNECSALEVKVSEGQVALNKLEQAFSAQQAAMQKAKDDYNRRVAMLTDESWSKSLEIDRLQKSESSLSAQLAGIGSEAFAKAKALNETSEAFARLQQDYKNLQREHSVYSAELNQFKQNSDSIYGARSELNDEVRRLRAECTDYRNQLKSSVDQVSTARAALASQALELQHAHFESDRSIAMLKAEHSLQMTTKVSEIENVKDACERKIARLGQHFELEKEKFLALEGKLNAQINELRSERASQVRLVKDANATIVELNKSLEQSLKECARLQLEAERFHTMEVSLKSEIARLGGEIALKSRLYEQSQITASEVVALRATANERAIEIERSKSEIEKLVAEHTRQVEVQVDLKNQIATQAQKLSELEGAEENLTKLQADYSGQNVQIADLLKQVALKNEQVKEVSEEALILRELVEDQTKRMDHAKSEIATLKQNIRQGFDSRDAMTELERERLEKWSAQLAVREQQLRHYATSLNKEKTDLKGFSKQIAGEIQMVSRTHPLKDYLKATEFELSKVELQLKTTPTLSPERAKLEHAVGQLMEQREFLKAILVSAQTQFEGQVATLEKIVQNSKLAVVPPPPPAAQMPKANTPSTPDVW
jgi:chromosome segregation ATPase